MSKPISAIGNRCEHCDKVQVNKITPLKGIEVEYRFKCKFNTGETTYKQACTIYDWAKCPYNDDK
jgi:hypothetical protein